MPKKAEEARVKEHYSEDCRGKPVAEYQDSEGKHWHCPLCGLWRVSR